MRNCDVKDEGWYGIVWVSVNDTQQKMNNLFWPEENSHEQCFAAHIVQGCQQYCSTLLHLIAGQFRLNNTEQYC